ncbi:Ca2+-binding RTX toxin-like protein [Inquilinus ginsengisoli]|uniref:calcium-binding protein n=1 Tax=Inquilinus ginsengisoli TaxID=363840 RepID=UPI003D1F47D5
MTDVYLTVTNTSFAHGDSTDSFRIFGSAAGDYVATGSGGDLLYGFGGNDWLGGGEGYDRLIGGTGDDTYLLFDVTLLINPLREAYDAVIEEADGGIDTIIILPAPSQFGGLTTHYTLPENVENGTFGGYSEPFDLTGNAADNRLYGSDGANALDGRAGDDALKGDEGNDALSGGEGDDTLDGQEGIDALDGGAGNDTYVLAGDADTISDSSGIDTLLSTTSRSLADFPAIENLTLAGTEAIDGTGSALDNVLTGNSASNLLSGGAGNDRLDGGAGSDTMRGASGDDTYVIDESGDGLTRPGRVRRASTPCSPRSISAWPTRPASSAMWRI